MTFYLKELLHAFAHRAILLFGAVDMGNNAVQPALEVRAQRVHTNRRIALELAVLVFLAASRRIFAEKIAEDARRHVTHEVLAVNRDGIVALVVHDFDRIVHRAKELFLSLLDRLPDIKFLLHDGAHQLEERFLSDNIRLEPRIEDVARSSVVTALAEQKRIRLDIADVFKGEHTTHFLSEALGHSKPK